ncbi:phosphate acyltransferase PlsX [Thioalkalivibrio thiocyanodenitrificans]|uniref:phosphate acyltransferase PlsX n=1 Tax=Thioalkalivibrio thiocyanodenitrificans TaxID=243063 RepID=UPI00037CE022|nr:phosphate acyltransferase PlsX [Thioalkalivibrio thiocyanodenitrificans]
MSEAFTIALDAMGGDHGPNVVIPAALRALRDFSDIELVLVGDEALLTEEISRHAKSLPGRLRIHHAGQVVGMDEPPAQALRGKKDSSMRVAINLVKEGAAHACVSAGNTGALMATARYVLKTLPGIDRPAIIAAIPSIHGHTHMLDLGANVDCTAEHLFQFAVMGSVLVGAVDNDPNPRVGLLNIGQEAIKGSDKIKEAARLLEQSNLNYVGFVEGDDIFCGEVDVVVCDGFVGNVSLKTGEGVARMVTHFLRKEFKRNLLTRFAALFALPILNALKKRIDPRRYNGASLLGLQGIVIKSHGSADIVSFANAIRIARIEVDKKIAQRIDKQLEQLLTERESS